MRQTLETFCENISGWVSEQIWAHKVKPHVETKNKGDGLPNPACQLQWFLYSTLGWTEDGGVAGLTGLRISA